MKPPSALKAALDETGLPYEIERGGRHAKIKLAGRLVGILPKGSGNEAHSRSLMNTISQVRRMARELRA